MKAKQRALLFDIAKTGIALGLGATGIGAPAAAAIAGTAGFGLEAIKQRNVNKKNIFKDGRALAASTLSGALSAAGAYGAASYGQAAKSATSSAASQTGQVAGRMGQSTTNMQATNGTKEIVENGDRLLNGVKQMNKYEKTYKVANIMNIAKAGTEFTVNAKTLNDLDKLEAPKVESVSAPLPKEVRQDYGAQKQSMKDDLLSATSIKQRIDEDMGVNDSNTSAALMLGQSNKINAQLAENMYRDEAANEQLRSGIESANAQMANQALNTSAQLNANFNMLRGQMASQAMNAMVNSVSAPLEANINSQKTMIQRFDDLIKLREEATINKDDESLKIINEELDRLSKLLGYKK